MAERINTDNFDKKVEEMINDYKATKEKPYDPTEDVKDIVAMILDKFSNNKNYMSGIKTLIDKVQVDEENDTIFFEVEDGFDESDCEDCDDKENCDTYKGMNNITDGGCIVPTSTSEDTDYVRIFGDLSVDDLNRAIKQYKAEFDSYPYLIMNESTLKAFEDQCQGLTCSDMSLICDKIDDCDDCPVSDFDGEDMVIINYDCEKGTFNAYYTHDDNNHTIVIDNNLAFGVVKVR